MNLGDVAQVGLALAFIVVLVLGLGFAVRRMNGARFRGAADIEVVASTFLGPKERVLLLRVQDRQVLIGINAQCIAALGEFPAPEKVPGAFDAVLREASR